MMELELQLDAFLDSPYFPLSFAENRLAVFYNNDQLFGVCTRAFSLLSFSSTYSFYTTQGQARDVAGPAEGAAFR